MERKSLITTCIVVGILLSISVPVSAGQQQSGTPMSSSGREQMRSESMQQEQTRSMTATDTSAQQQMQSASRERTQLMNMTAEQLEGKSLFNAGGEKLGKVDMIMRNRASNRVEAIVSVGGLLGMGAKKIAVPLQQVNLEQDRLVLDESISLDEFKKLAAYREDDYQNVSERQSLAEITGMAPGTKRMTFQQLDKDSSGFITHEEAEVERGLYSNWEIVDQNTDNQIDRAEFSAFEQARTPAIPSGAEGER